MAKKAGTPNSNKSGGGDSTSQSSSRGGGSSGNRKSGGSSSSGNNNNSYNNADSRSSSRRSGGGGGNNNHNPTSSRGSRSRGNSSSANSNNNHHHSGGEEDHPDLAELEERLNEDVDEEFFQDPRKFHTLHRVIDVLGMQLADDLSSVRGGNNGGPSSPQQWHRIDKNPAYRALKDQQQVVEEAIEHLALIHCADLNGSVVQVGKVARQFHDAVSQVRLLRKQVKEIQETMGAGGHGLIASGMATGGGNATGKQTNSGTSNNGAAAVAAATAAASSAMSLRELWLKKLECEAVLSLLEKLDTIRAAPLQFDSYINQQRIGAAVLTVAQALDTMFSSDVSQVQALHKIMEQLMIRKQRAEEVVWELLLDVLFLRTGNGLAQITALYGGYNTRNDGSSFLLGEVSVTDKFRRRTGPSMIGSTGNTGVTGGSVTGGGALDGTSVHNKDGGDGGINMDASNGGPTSAAAAASLLWNLPPSSWEYIYRQQSGMVNPFLSNKMRFALDPDLQVDSILLTMEQRKHGSAAAEILVDEDFYEDEEDDPFNATSIGGGMATIHEGDGTGNNTDEKKQDTSKAIDSNERRARAVIPPSMLEAEFDLEADERRSLEEQQFDSQGRRRQQTLHVTKPTYLDHVLAIRTLVECLVRLRRLDDVERIVTEALEREVSQLVQREQARTFVWVEKQSSAQLRKSGRYGMLLTKAGATTDLRDFRKHLNHILSAFGNVQIRLVHLTQIVRQRIVSFG